MEAHFFFPYDPPHPFVTVSCVRQVDDDYFPIVESAMDDSREALQKFCQQDMSADPRLPPMNLNDQVSVSAGGSVGVSRLLKTTAARRSARPRLPPPRPKPSPFEAARGDL